MLRDRFFVLALLVLLELGCTVQDLPPTGKRLAVEARTSLCSMASASPWIERWFGAWELSSHRILRLPDAPPPELVFFDSTCIYTTSAVTAGGAPAVDGPALRGSKLPWRAVPHNGSTTLPDGEQVPVQLMSFASSSGETGPFFVMAAPSFWAETGHVEEPLLTGVFLHEFAHTRQVAGVAAIIGPIDAGWPYEEELSDDSVQTHFQDDPAYVEAFLAERDLLYRAAAAASVEEARALAAEVVGMMKRRRARWFTGNREVFATLDDVFLVMEGVGQWTAFAWLGHPEGGGMDREAAIQTMLGRRRWWTQDQGLALFLLLDRLLPEWPSLAFGVPSTGARELLERAAAP